MMVWIMSDWDKKVVCIGIVAIVLLFIGVQIFTKKEG